MKLYKLEFQPVGLHPENHPLESIYFIEGKGIIEGGEYTSLAEASDYIMPWINKVIANPEEYREHGIRKMRKYGSSHFTGIMEEKEITEEQLQQFLDAKKQFANAKEEYRASLETLVRIGD